MYWIGLIFAFDRRSSIVVRLEFFSIKCLKIEGCGRRKASPKTFIEMSFHFVVILSKFSIESVVKKLLIQSFALFG